MTNKLFQKLLRKYLEGNCSPEEEILVENWIHAVGSDSMQLLSPKEEEILKNKYWEKINKHIKGTSDRENKFPYSINKMWKYAAVAAVYLLIGAASFFLATKSIQNKGQTADKVLTGPGMVAIMNEGIEVKKINLPDGSFITLKPGSKISFFEKFNKARREVYLSGEAFFQVARNVKRPFFVFSKGVITKVLGTSFVIKALPNEKNVTVAVKTGKVYVYADEKTIGNINKQTILTPNQQVVYNMIENKVSRSIVEKPLPILPAAEIKKLHFEDAPVKDIIKELEKYYGISIEVDKEKFKNCALTTSISDGGIYNRLDIICKAIGATYSVDETHITIEGQGCN